jgi:hypothetical protein
MAKSKNQKVNPADVINMADYDLCAPLHESCIGCAKIFDHVALVKNAAGQYVREGEVTPKCRVYNNPATKWPGNESYAVHTATVVRRDETGKIISRQPEEVQITEKICPMATHVRPTEVAEQSAKVLVGQQKQKKKR